MSVRGVALLIAVVALCFVALPSAALAVTLSDYEAQVLQLVNKERTQRHLVKLTVSSKLVAAARAHSTEMGELQYFSHDSYSGESFRERVIRFGFTKKGYKIWKAGENIAWGSGLCGIPQAIVAQWMASRSHRAVILTKAFRSAGIGVVLWEEGFGECEDPVYFYTLDLGRRSK
jgi:uncharacterized protein YkwD